MNAFFQRLSRMVRHRWTDDALVNRLIAPTLLTTLTQRVSASERRHTGEIRICIEGGLPMSYLWRDAPARERALMMFGKLRVWDTENNNGVLIYLLLADHAIEIVADRGIHRQVDPQAWALTTQQMADAFRQGRFEDGLTQALEEVSALLVAQFPLDGQSPDAPNRNELPDAPVVI